MTEKSSELLLKNIYMPILKKNADKKILIAKLEKALVKVSKTFTVNNQLFTYTSYRSNNDCITISKILLNDYTYFTYINLITRIRRCIELNQYNGIIDDRKARIRWVRGKKNFELQLETFYELQVKLFEYYEELTFEQYIQES
jgi:hypothetical protein